MKNHFRTASMCKNRTSTVTNMDKIEWLCCSLTQIQTEQMVENYVTF